MPYWRSTPKPEMYWPNTPTPPWAPSAPWMPAFPPKSLFSIKNPERWYYWTTLFRQQGTLYPCSITISTPSHWQHLPALFDDAAQQLLLTDLDLNIVNSTPIDAGSDFHPALIDVSLDKNILLSDSLLGILFFDKFGSFERKLPLTGVKSLQMQGEHLYYLQEGNLYNYDLSALDIILVANGLSDVKAFRRTNSTLYLLNDKGALLQRPVLRSRR